MSEVGEDVLKSSLGYEPLSQSEERGMCGYRMEVCKGVGRQTDDGIGV